MQNKRTKRMDKETKSAIIYLARQGKKPTEIAKILDNSFSNTAIRAFLNKNNISTSKEKDRSRPCKICGKVFTPKNYDGESKSKYVLCSKECSNISKKESRRYSKYSKDQINKVIELKQKKFTNNEIVKITKVNLNTVKSIIKEEKLKLTPKEHQTNAHKGKLNKNPSCMEDMRNSRITCETNKFNIKINKIKNQLEKNEKYSIPYLCKKYNMHDTSVRRAMHLRDWSHLIGNSRSGSELEIYDFVKEHLDENLEIIQGDRKVLKGKELDIYIPNLNLAIEYCGLYWHNENSPEPRGYNYHYNKMKDCEKESVRLITIFEDEWEERRSQVKNFLKSVLGYSKKRIYARKCEIKEVSKENTFDFLNKNHIQGKTRFKLSYGLFFEDKLVGLITGNIHHRQGNDGVFILNRLVFKDSYQVIGGASKLLKYLIKNCKELGYNKLVSWSDNRWSQGNVYEKIGFYLSDDLKPDYSYYIGSNQRESKQANTKINLIKKGALGNMDNTEKELAQSLGYEKIWDCGKKRWEIDL